MKLLPEDVYKNIVILNKHRNTMVHTLEVNIDDMFFYKSSGERILIKKPKISIIIQKIKHISI